MTRTSPWIAAVILALASAASAYADPITGTISVSGNDTFDSHQITFTPNSGTVYQASGTLAAFAPFVVDGYTAQWEAALTNFAFATADGTTIFSTVNHDTGQTASFTITDLLTEIVGSDSNGPTLSLAGWGYFSESGYDTTSGRFSLTSSSATITGFQLVADAASTPEPGSLVLLGTGMAGMITGFLRRRRTATAEGAVQA